MTLHDQTEKAKNDWNKLAKDALDLWQNHLTSLANDPKAKEELAQLVGPMGKMFSDWTEMVQQGMAGMMPNTTSCRTSPASEAKTETSAPEASSVKDEASPVLEEQPVLQTQEEEDQGVEDKTHELQSTQSTSTPVSEEPDASSSDSQTRPRSENQSGSAVSSDGHRNMVELADRLAFLERELEELRVKREQEKGGRLTEDALDSADQPVQQMAGTDQR